MNSSRQSEVDKQGRDSMRSITLGLGIFIALFAMGGSALADGAKQKLLENLHAFSDGLPVSPAQKAYFSVDEISLNVLIGDDSFPIPQAALLKLACDILSNKPVPMQIALPDCGRNPEARMKRGGGMLVELIVAKVNPKDYKQALTIPLFEVIAVTTRSDPERSHRAANYFEVIPNLGDPAQFDADLSMVLHRTIGKIAESLTYDAGEAK